MGVRRDKAALCGGCKSHPAIRPNTAPDKNWSNSGVPKACTNIVPPLLVQATLATAAAITAEASLSFLGLVSSRPTGARAICSIPPKISCRRRRGRRSGGDTEVRPMPDNSVRVGFGA